MYILLSFSDPKGAHGGNPPPLSIAWTLLLNYNYGEPQNTVGYFAAQVATHISSLYSLVLFDLNTTMDSQVKGQ